MIEQITNAELITGADSIAQFLNLRGRKKIYHLLEMKRLGKSDIPIWNEPGLGVVASKEALLRYMAIKSGMSPSVPVAASKAE
jgi:hypothetical protein